MSLQYPRHRRLLQSHRTIFAAYCVIVVNAVSKMTKIIPNPRTSNTKYVSVMSDVWYCGRIDGGVAKRNTPTDTYSARICLRGIAAGMKLFTTI